MISFMAVSQMAVEGTSFSLSSSRNACFASSRVAYCGFASSLGRGGKKEADEIEGGGKKEAEGKGVALLNLYLKLLLCVSQNQL